jgi:MoaA/NifB/PqqE/SkfB family radical SAM enzyme
MRFNNLRCYRRILFSKKLIPTVLKSRRNIIAFENGRAPVAGPYMAELDITYRCNCRCEMCQRWSDPRRGELSLEEYQALAKQFYKLGVHQISVAGGEPLLRSDVFSIIESFAKLDMSVNLCTNGLLLQKYRDEIYSSGATCVSVSLDGATAECHDAIRGIPGSYRQIEKGIETLLSQNGNPETRPIIRVRMTISNHNADEIRAFYEKWDQKVDDVLLQPVHHCQDSSYTGLDDKNLNIDPQIVAEQIAGTPLANDAYMKQLVNSLKSYGSFPDQRCYAGVLMARIDPWGIVYPCLEQHVEVGNLREKNFESIWASHRFNIERQRLASNRQCTCWYNNTALIGHYGKILKFTHRQALFNVMRDFFFNNLPQSNKHKQRHNYR